MSLELLNTLGSFLTVAIVGATAIAALVQLRHLRAGNQITALLAVQNELDSPDFRAAEIIVRQELAAALQDGEFCEYEIAMSQSRPTPANARYLEIRQAANLVANTFENLGALVKNGIFDRWLFLDIYCWVVAGYWKRLEGLTAIARAASGERSIYENFEYIAAISQEFLDSHPDTYPPNVERLDVQLPDAAKRLLG